MSTLIKYFAHFDTIIFPPLPKNIASNATVQTMPPAGATISAQGIILGRNASAQEYSDQHSPTHHFSLAALLATLHQDFLKQQAQLHEHHQEVQLQLWQRLLQSVIAQPTTISIEKVSLPGPKFSRVDLEAMASGEIAPYFGGWFKPLDHLPRLIRMPEPPLLLADRVTGIDAIPHSFATGTIWTETDVGEDAWYLHQGHMPAGITIESGQADLLLASWLGFDFYNQGERVYRLLGCELSFHGDLPKPGETLCYDIHIDGHAKQGDIRIFFFHYDCHIDGQLRVRVRNAQAGFFSDQELAESGGVLWDPHEDGYDSTLALDPPPLKTSYSHFNQQQLLAFSQGDVLSCFGPGFERALTHTCTPKINSGPMLFLNEITHFDLQGGPWQRGYIRAIQNIQPEDWFFQGHFKNDPCMPGTLMLEGGLQLAACYLTAMGFTLNRDGWRFAPVTEQSYKLRCRGQVRPHAKQVVYEIFISGVIAEPIPTVYGDLLGTVDGLKSFHTRIGLKLMPDWPLNQNPTLRIHETASHPLAPVVQGFKFDANSLLACAWGKPSQAFGDLYRPFDNHRKVPRSPAPPYHFISRIAEIQAKMGELASGGEALFEYDVPLEAWYFSDNNYSTMPFCVLLESVLQPCGWLAAFAGSVLHAEKDLLFRNLDGTATWSQEILPGSGCLRTRVKMTHASQSAGMILETFKVSTHLNDTCIFTMDTVFGFFPQEAFTNMAGLPIPDYEKDILQRPANVNIDLSQTPPAFSSGNSALPKGMLLMLNRVTGFWRESGNFLAQLRAEKIVDPNDWFFKAHFLNDPVQPGSLGIEAMIQLLQFYMLQENLHAGMTHPRFMPLALDCPISWKYRGQVVPEHKLIQIVVNVIETGKNSEGAAYAKAESSLWVDGLRIYEVKNLELCIVETE